jgi:hypothetical protein
MKKRREKAHGRPFEAYSVLVLGAVCSFLEPFVNWLGGGVVGAK